MSSPPPADDDFDDALDLRIEAAMARVRLQMDPYLGPLKTAISAANMDVQAFRRKEYPITLQAMMDKPRWVDMRVWKTDTSERECLLIQYQRMREGNRHVDNCYLKLLEDGSYPGGLTEADKVAWLHLPGKDGVQLFRRLSANDPDDATHFTCKNGDRMAIVPGISQTVDELSRKEKSANLLITLLEEAGLAGRTGCTSRKNGAARGSIL